MIRDQPLPFTKRRPSSSTSAVVVVVEVVVLGDVVDVRFVVFRGGKRPLRNVKADPSFKSSSIPATGGDCTVVGRLNPGFLAPKSFILEISSTYSSSVAESNFSSASESASPPKIPIPVNSILSDFWPPVASTEPESNRKLFGTLDGLFPGNWSSSNSSPCSCCERVVKFQILSRYF